MAMLVGTAILLGAGWAGGAALVAFFIGSTAVSRIIPDATARFDAKGTTRDAWQVAANGGPAALGALLQFALPGVAIWIVTTSLASAAADTWATSVGSLSRTWPRDILTGRSVPAGTSGGVTILGCLGALAGAGLVGGIAAFAAGEPALLACALALGFTGMLLDSLLGATLQARYHCPRCDVSCERPLHRCGTRAVHQKGWRALSNDGVNALAASAAGVGGWVVVSLVR
jgi:uncharacterized protein (TIGR00297 family)